MRNIHKKEPVLTGFAGLIAALVVVLIAFGVHVSGDQRDALIGLAIAAAPVVAWVRSQVHSIHKS